MSITGFSDTSKLHKKAFHRRNDSEELDVFEAARYFSGYNEASPGYNNIGATYTQKSTREDYHHKHNWRGGRMSLDVPSRNPITQQAHTVLIEKQILKEKKCKQPSSPGGRLASFLNSLFNQTSSKKKKSKSTNDINIEEESAGGGRRRRRSSISHFRSSSTNTDVTTSDSKSLYNSSSSSGFRTPPPCAHTPTKNYKDFRSYSDHHHKQVVSLPSKPINGKFQNDHQLVLDDKRDMDTFSFDGGFPEKPIHKCLEEDGIDWVGNSYQYASENKEFKKFNTNEVVDDGAESDSSSDLFELQNYDLGLDIYSTGLPVYETTNMDSIKRGAPISSGTI